MQVYSLSKVLKKVSSGVSGTYTIEVNAYGKTSLTNPLVVVNEYICAHLGTSIGLPIPPCALLQPKGTVPSVWFGSMSYSLSGHTLPPIDPDECVKTFENLSVAVVLFDIWIANSDRHIGNLSVDKAMSKHRLNVFDHSHALFSSEGMPRLTRLMGKFGIDQMAETGANRHCLLDFLKSDTDFEEWVRRIENTPTWLIEKLCWDTVGIGLLSEQEANRAWMFLRQRSSELRRIIEENKHEFNSMSWSWFSSNTPAIWDGPHI
jgi:hypothetical protein